MSSRGASRRTVLLGGVGFAAGAVLGACTAPHAATRPTGASAPTLGERHTQSPSAAAAHDPGWVRIENARPGTTAWRIPTDGYASETDLAGYTDTSGALPGTPVRLRLSSTLGAVTVTAYRLGDYGGLGARLVWRSTPVRVGRQAAPTTDRLGTVRCHWPVTMELDTTDWPEGSYLLHLAAGGKARHVPLTVCSAITEGRLALVSAVACYQAYNTWGGHSLYRGPDGSFATRARAVSFDRPYDTSGAKNVLSFELGPVRLAESLGLDLAYLTSWSLHDEPDLLAGARGVVSLGHDEYWSVPMRRATERARDRGTNVAFLGANAAYWRIRFDSAGRLVTCYKSATEDPVQGRPDTTAMWRADPHPDPENSLTGLLYEAFPAAGDLTISDPTFFGFDGLGLHHGSVIPGLIATEVDRAYPLAGTPDNLQVVGHSRVPLAGRPATYSDFAYYTTASGAGVIDVGTMGWCTGLRGGSATHGIGAPSVGFARAVTARILTAMARGPVGRTHPARGNLAVLGASASTGTGTGGPIGSG